MATLKISALQDGRYRAGRQWSREGAVCDSADFSDDQLAQLEADPLIVVEQVEDKPAPSKAKSKAKAKGDD